MKPYKIAVFSSGLERSLAGSKYNMRQDECKSAAYALKAYSGMEYGKFIDTRLREVPVEIFEQYKKRLPETWRMRAQHYYSEELKTLYDIMWNTDGIYGGRFSGSGFKGCCMALIDPAYAESIEKQVEKSYLDYYPALKGKYSFHLCESVDGVLY